MTTNKYKVVIQCNYDLSQSDETITVYGNNKTEVRSHVLNDYPKGSITIKSITL